jgi:hypothetical protein
MPRWLVENNMGWDNGHKFMSAKKLRELLEKLPDDSHVFCNMVSNIGIYDPTGEVYLGFIDFSSEQLDMKE